MPQISHILGQEESVLSLPDEVLQSVQTLDTAGVVDEFKRSLEIDEVSLQEPDDDTKRWVRCLCKTAPHDKRVDLVQHLRQITPAGTTGIFEVIYFFPFCCFDLPRGLWLKPEHRERTP